MVPGGERVKGGAQSLMGGSSDRAPLYLLFDLEKQLNASLLPVGKVRAGSSLFTYKIATQSLLVAWKSGGGQSCGTCLSGDDGKVLCLSSEELSSTLQFYLFSALILVV